MILLSLNKGLFGSAIAVVFQSAFYANMYQNDFFFYFFKIIFKINVSKQSKTHTKINF